MNDLKRPDVRWNARTAPDTFATAGTSCCSWGCYARPDATISCHTGHPGSGL